MTFKKLGKKRSRLSCLSSNQLEVEDKPHLKSPSHHVSCVSFEKFDRHLKAIVMDRSTGLLLVHARETFLPLFSHKSILPRRRPCTLILKIGRSCFGCRFLRHKLSFLLSLQSLTDDSLVEWTWCWVLSGASITPEEDKIEKATKTQRDSMEFDNAFFLGYFSC